MSIDNGNLTAINIARDNPNFSSIDGVLYNKQQTTLYHCPRGKTGTVTISNLATTIGREVFFYCAGLTSITIGNAVTRIGGGAFQNCTGLTTVSIPSSVISIEYNAFGGCSGLTSVVSHRLTPPQLIDGMTEEIYRNATLYVPAASLALYQDASGWRGFYDIRAIGTPDSYTITSSAGANGSISPIGATTVNYGNSQTYTITPNAGYEIDQVLVDGVAVANGNYTFSNVTANHTIHVTFTVQFTITSSAGANGNISPIGITTVNYGGSQIYVITPNADYEIDQILVDGVAVANGNYTFSNVTANHTIHVTFKQIQHGQCGANLYWDFNSITGELSITGTGDMYDYDVNKTPWYNYISNITAVSLPDGMTHIGNNAFHACWVITSVNIPNSVTTIGETAFAWCMGLTSVTIPNSVTVIGSYAFLYCQLISVTNHSLTPQIIGDNYFGSAYILYVPAESLALYQAAAGWKEFFNIQTIGTSSINNFSADKPAIVGYYSILGRELPQEPENDIYIIRYDNGKTEKRTR